MFDPIDNTLFGLDLYQTDIVLTTKLKHDHLFQLSANDYAQVDPLLKNMLLSGRKYCRSLYSELLEDSESYRRIQEFQGLSPLTNVKLECK